MGLVIEREDGYIFETNYWNGVAKVHKTNGERLNIRSNPDDKVTAGVNECATLFVLNSGLKRQDKWWWLIEKGRHEDWESAKFDTGWVSGKYLRQPYTDCEKECVHIMNVKDYKAKCLEFKNCISQKCRIVINEDKIGWMTQYGTKYWALKGYDYIAIIKKFYDKSPKLGIDGQSVRVSCLQHTANCPAGMHVIGSE